MIMAETTKLNITDDREIKVCCATFYQSKIVRTLFGDVFHPGGLALTRHLGEMISLGPDDQVLDVACGRGSSATHLAKTFACHVTGLDYGHENIAAAQASAAAQGVAHLTTFRQGDAEGLPFDENSFDAVISECSFCTFPDKATAATEMARVLRRNGRLGLTDMTISGPLPDEIQTLLAWVACVAGAGTPENYVSILRAAGLSNYTIEDQRGALLEMMHVVRRKLLGIEFAVGLGKLSADTNLTELAQNLDLEGSKRLARRAVELIEGGTVGYTLITAQKESTEE